MFSKNPIFTHSLLTTALLLGSLQLHGTTTSTWTGDFSFDMNRNRNWDDSIPYDGLAIFNGDGVHSPLSFRDEGIEFEEMQFTADTTISVISRILTSGSQGIVTTPGVTATFFIYEHQPLIYPPADVRVISGPAGNGGGTVEYNLGGYGQLYAFSGSSGGTIVNITMTEGNNYFEVDGSGDNLFNNINSDADTDEIYILAGANLIIGGAETNTINALITGDGALTKTGTGTLILNGTNTFTGGTNVTQGLLEINGMLPGNLNLAPSAMLKGNGTIEGTVFLSGTVSPGNSIGTLNVGSFVFSSSGIFDLEIDSTGSSDQIIATDSITLDGVLNILPLDLAFTAPQTYQILQAGNGISGTFSSVQNTVPALVSLNYQPNDVSLSYLPISVIGLQGNAKAAAD